MANRVIKDTICTSDNLNELSDFEFRLWVGLLVSADDAGRGDARPAIIKGHCFPLRERVTVKDIDVALHGLAAHSCVSLYTVGGKPYYSFPTWAAHQRIDRAKPKFPPPEDADEHCDDLPSNDRNCDPSAAVCGNPRQSAATRRNPPQAAASRGLNPIQSKTIQSNPEAENAREAAAAGNMRIEAYAAANLDHLSPANMDELTGFAEDLSDELVRYAIDEACAHGKRAWAYVRSVLRRYMSAGYKSIGEVKAAQAQREQQKQPEAKTEPEIRWF